MCRGIDRYSAVRLFRQSSRIPPTLCGFAALPMKVETQTGDFHGTRGRTIGDPEGLIDPLAPRVHVALRVDAERFVSEFTARIGGILG